MELTTFSAISKSFKAEEGNNDDLAMTLVNFGWLTAQRYFKENINTDIRRVLQEEQLNIMDQDIVPFGIVDNGVDDPFDAGDKDAKERWIAVQRYKDPFTFSNADGLWDILSNRERL